MLGQSICIVNTTGPLQYKIRPRTKTKTSQNLDLKIKVETLLVMLEKTKEFYASQLDHWHCLWMSGFEDPN